MLSLKQHGSLLLFYWRTIISKHRRTALLISSLMIGSALFEAATIGSAVPILDAIVRGASGTNSRVLRLAENVLFAITGSSNRNTVVLALLLFANTLFLIDSCFTILTRYMTTKAGIDLRRETKHALFDRVLHASYGETVHRGRGVLLNTVELLAERGYLAMSHLSKLFTSVASTVLLLVLMVYLSWWATLMIGVFALFGVFAIRKITDSRARQAGVDLHIARVKQSCLTVDGIDGIKVIKANNLEGHITKRLWDALAEEVRPTLRLEVFRSLPVFINEFGVATVVLFLAGLTFLFPGLGMTFPVLVAFLMAIRRCSPALASINASLVELESLRRDIEAVEDVLQGMPGEQSGAQVCSGVEQILFENVSFKYPARREPVLNRIDLVVRHGTVTAIVGATGSGKSTIASLLLALYRPEAGTITVDGLNLAEIDLSSWRRRIGYVSQDIFLFNGTIRDNIGLWNDAISDSEIEDAARIAQIDDFVRSLPDGYNTAVGDRGLRLSGGQCQRVAIARAIVRRPQVLIFDEATSALDTLTERAVYEAISVFRKDTLIVVIAHRLSTIRDADQIVVLDSGRIVESGTHDSLCELRGRYARLYEIEASDAQTV